MNKIVGRPKTAGVRPPNGLGGVVVRMPIKEDKKKQRAKGTDLQTGRSWSTLIGLVIHFYYIN